MLEMQNKGTNWKNTDKTYTQQRTCIQNSYSSINSPNEKLAKCGTDTEQKIPQKWPIIAHENLLSNTGHQKNVNKSTMRN